VAAAAVEGGAGRTSTSSYSTGKREGVVGGKNTPGQKSAQRSVELSPTEQLEPPTTHTDIYCILYTHKQETGISW